MNFDHFDIIGPIYDHVFGRHTDYEIVELAGIEPGQSVLDVAGGTGRVSVLFREQGAKVHLVDTAAGMLNQAREKGLRKLSLGESEHLPYATRRFDRVIIVDAFHHVADQGTTLKEMWRVLAPGGRLIIEEPDVRHFAVKLIRLGEKLLQMRSHFLAPDRIMAMAKTLQPDKVALVAEKGNAWVTIIKKISDS
ncbi:MAG: methyltransferase domain-containing protein [Chloroflexota bacterium]|nr:methyltransferase domain-containing protein [Chloroflexota bacterium]